jgi:glycosyltransferase involved in cell wall biosynthesis
MKLALVHDDLVQWGGAERVLIALSELFPEAPIYTSVYDRQNPMLAEAFKGKVIKTSFMQNILGWRSYYKALLPLYPIAFEQFDFSEYDVVISQTTRFAKSIITKPGTIHICYCHTPPRFLWDFSGEEQGPLPSFYKSWLKRYDESASTRVDQWWAGSKNAQDRIQNVYNQSSSVVYPFVDLKRFEAIEPFDGGYLLVIARLNQYKHVDIVIQAAKKLSMPLKIVGSGPQMSMLQGLAGDSSLIHFLGRLDEETVLQVLAGCKALVVAGEEDFGLTPLEAQALGKPVIAYQKGGALETVITGETGYLFDKQTPDSLISALKLSGEHGYNESSCRKQAARFDKQIFMKKVKDELDAIIASSKH